MEPHPNQQPHEPLFPGLVPIPIPSLPLAAPPDARGSPTDFNAAVILAAMLCALVCALGLNSMLQCVLHGTRRIFTEPAEWVTARRASAGLKKDDVTALPTDTYAMPGSPATASECAICLAEFADGDRIRVLPQCNHQFHVACIDTWLISHSSCPTCRNCLSLEVVTTV